LRKGQEDYTTVLVDLDRRVPVGFVCSRKHKDIKAVLKGWSAAVQQQVIEVSMDLSGNNRSLIGKLMPDANIIADRFHVMKLVGDKLNTALNQAKKANASIQDAAEKARMKEAFKQSKYALLKLEENLTEKQKLKLVMVQKHRHY